MCYKIVHVQYLIQMYKNCFNCSYFCSIIFSIKFNYTATRMEAENFLLGHNRSHRSYNIDIFGGEFDDKAMKKRAETQQETCLSQFNQRSKLRRLEDSTAKTGKTDCDDKAVAGSSRQKPTAKSSGQRKSNVNSRKSLQLKQKKRLGTTIRKTKDKTTKDPSSIIEEASAAFDYPTHISTNMKGNYFKFHIK